MTNQNEKLSCISDGSKLREPCLSCTLKHLSAAIFWLSEASRLPVIYEEFSNYDAFCAESGYLVPRIADLFSADVMLRRARILTHEALTYGGLDLLAMGLIQEVEKMLAHPRLADYEDASLLTNFRGCAPEVIEQLRNIRVEELVAGRYKEAYSRLTAVISRMSFDSNEEPAYSRGVTAAESVLSLISCAKEACAHIEEAMREYPIVCDGSAVDYETLQMTRPDIMDIILCVTSDGSVSEDEQLESPVDAWDLSRRFRVIIANLYGVVLALKKQSPFSVDDKISVTNE